MIKYTLNMTAEELARQVIAIGQAKCPDIMSVDMFCEHCLEDVPEKVFEDRNFRMIAEKAKTMATMELKRVLFPLDWTNRTVEDLAEEIIAHVLAQHPRKINKGYTHDNFWASKYHLSLAFVDSVYPPGYMENMRKSSDLAYLKLGDILTRKEQETSLALVDDCLKFVKESGKERCSKDAVKLFLQTRKVEFTPANRDLLYAKVNEKMGVIIAPKGKTKKPTANAEAPASLEIINPESWYGEGQKIRLLVKRLEYYNAGLNLDPSFHALAWLGIGQAQLGLKYFADAGKAFQKSIELNLDMPILWQSVGKLCRERGDLRGAEKAFARVVELVPSDQFACFDLGGVRKLLNERDGAIQAFERVVALNPADCGAWTELSTLYSNPPDIIRALERVNQIVPREPMQVMMLGHALANNKDFGRAADIFNEVVDDDCSIETFGQLIVLANLLAGQFQAAKTACERVLIFDPENADGLGFLAAAQRGLGDDASAEQTCITALRDHSYNEEAWVVLADICEGRGQEAETLYCWEQVLETTDPFVATTDTTEWEGQWVITYKTERAEKIQERVLVLKKKGISALSPLPDE